VSPPHLAAVAGPAAPTGAAYDLVLVLHVIAALIGLATVVASGVQSARLLATAPGRELSPSLVQYFTPGVNWAGRTLYAVPVLGFALLAMSKGAFDLADGWVLWGLVLWLATALGAELALWPAERRIQGAMAAAARRGVAARRPGISEAPQLTADCQVVLALSGVVVVLLVLAAVLMVAK
jgi:hypothetical protein